MAKKVRRKPDEAEEEEAFEFPVFDEAGFAAKEFELTTAVAIGAGIAVVLGALAWLATAAGLPWYLPFGLGFLVVIFSPYLLGRLRRGSSAYTKGDWAGVLALEFFGFLALWFLLVNLT